MRESNIGFNLVHRGILWTVYDLFAILSLCGYAIVLSLLLFLLLCHLCCVDWLSDWFINSAIWGANNNKKILLLRVDFQIKTRLRSLSSIDKSFNTRIEIFNKNYRHNHGNWEKSWTALTFVGNWNKYQSILSKNFIEDYYRINKFLLIIFNNVLKSAF